MRIKLNGRARMLREDLSFYLMSLDKANLAEDNYKSTVLRQVGVSVREISILSFDLTARVQQVVYGY